MVKTIWIVAALYCLTILCSCQKEVDPFTDTPPVTDSTATNDNYMPLTEGTYWIYKDSGFSNTYDTLTVLGDDTVINAITFTKVHAVGALQQSDVFYAVKDHNYYVNATENGINVTMQVLNDTTSVGNSWVYDMGTVNGIPGKGTGTVVEKLSTLAVGGKDYTDVIHTTYVMSYNILGTFTDFATYDFYFAKGKGVIKIKSVVSDILGAGNDIKTAQDLVDYSIK